ncbi:AI-2E family transporter [Planococcus sp. CP5-4]|uniref:AI-2E family transporter n=1 Tax=unclassified Planococcus (in: firmicutes) TaxID=2662419 RepID=UPI001C2340C4|nr:MULTISPECIES: AI-2E family transporter [unclassified Planococcus (in: firmicutes)]MBU9674034.1 AI-2E family transporter [Planococcus sp. CP5-4_YE]MBV0909905.1 AI-2E family transporter [Planococcus sp. CP5-4_UN]MBW6064785.1 AI-2E family transporter [Planococcus sp. CP5-4]
MPKTKWFLFLYSVVLILIIIYLAARMPFLLYPFRVIFSTIAPTIVVGGILYYIFRPLVSLLEKRMGHVTAILSIFALFTIIIFFLGTWLGPILTNQIMALINNFPLIAARVQQWVNTALESEWWRYIEEQEVMPGLQPSTLMDNFLNTSAGLGANLMDFLASVLSIVSKLVIVPFILFFLLKDGEHLPDHFLKVLPQDSREDGRKILQDMDENLSAYIQGQAIVSLFVGVLSLIAYMLLDLQYAVILALVSLFTNLIPFLGPFIGAVPVLVVAFLQEPVLALWTAIAILVIQQLESNLISPNVMGHKLAVHPVTIIFLLYIGASFAGIIGMILVIPVYAVGKAIVQNIYRLIRLKFPALR